MKNFRLFLIAVLAIIIAYTAFVIIHQGPNLFPDFFGDMMAMKWPGQFNLDFMSFLMLSALWVAWRNQFSAAGMGLAILAFFGGMVFLSIYLLYLTSRHRDDIGAVLLGPSRVQT